MFHTACARACAGDIGRNEAPRGSVGTRSDTRRVIRSCATLQPLCIEPGVNVLSDLVLCDTVALLDHALELIALTGNSVQIVVSEIAPLFLDLSLELLPISSVPFDHAGAPLIQQDLHRSLVRQRKQSFRRYLVGRFAGSERYFRTGFVRR